MGLRYRKTIKIMPGVRINFSKSGISTTVGPRGASMNMGKNGTYLNTGISGTGLYMREKIGEGRQTKTRQVSPSCSKEYDPEFLRRYEIYSPITIQINSRGNIHIVDKNGDAITDEFFLKKMKATQDYKKQKEQLVTQWREKSDQEYQEAQSVLSDLINIHKYSFDVHPLDYYEKELSSVILQKYQVKSFDQKEPSKHEIEAELVEFAEHHVTSKAFWRVKKLREEYVQNNLETEYQKKYNEWKKKKQEFDLLQQKEAEQKNAIYADEYDRITDSLKKKIGGSEEYVKEQLESWLSDSTLPVEVDLDYEYEEISGIMYIDLHLPPEDVIPQQEMVRLDNGGLKEKTKSKQIIQNEYANMIFGLGICIVSGVFDISPAVKRVLISGFAVRRNKNGDQVNDCLYSIKFVRDGFEGFSLGQQNPIEFVNRFENRYKATQTWKFKAISPYEDF